MKKSVNHECSPIIFFSFFGSYIGHRGKNSQKECKFPPKYILKSVFHSSTPNQTSSRPLPEYSLLFEQPYHPPNQYLKVAQIHKPQWSRRKEYSNCFWLRPSRKIEPIASHCLLQKGTHTQVYLIFLLALKTGLDTDQSKRFLVIYLFADFESALLKIQFHFWEICFRFKEKHFLIGVPHCSFSGTRLRFRDYPLFLFYDL